MDLNNLNMDGVHQTSKDLKETIATIKELKYLQNKLVDLKEKYDAATSTMDLNAIAFIEGQFKTIQQQFEILTKSLNI
jgi:hypothetical protein